MFSEVGVKPYLSSGIASAASTNSFSIMLISRSTTALKVGGAEGVGWAWGADGACGEAGFCAIAPAAKLRTSSRQDVRVVSFIFHLLVEIIALPMMPGVANDNTDSAGCMIRQMRAV